MLVFNSFSKIRILVYILQMYKHTEWKKTLTKILILFSLSGRLMSDLNLSLYFLYFLQQISIFIIRNKCYD